MAKKEKEVTANEAIAQLTMFFREYVMIGAPDGALGAAIKALEKQVPKKVLGVETGLWHCPICNSNVNQEDKYCSICGQSIDFGDPIEDALRNILDQEVESFRNKSDFITKRFNQIV